MIQRIVTIVLLWLIALGVATPAHAQGATIDLDAYVSLLREARTAAARGDGIDLQLAADRIMEVGAVRLPDGSADPLDNSWLAAALDRPTPDLAAVAERLGALIDALALPESRAPADAQARLAAILSRPPFSQPEANDEPGLVERFFDWLFGWLGELLDPVAPAAQPGGSGLAWALAALGALIIGGLLVVWLRGLRRTLAPAAARLAADDPEANLSAADALEQAGALARGGDYRRATRFLYLSSLLWLDQRRLLRYDRSLTNREYLARLAERPALREQLRPVVETFDAVWYGDAPLDAAGFAAYERLVRALRETEHS